jgi:hypothetical protein
MKLWRNEGWVIPPGQDARFVWKMEQVLEVYKRPFHPVRPVIGFDECPKQLIGEVRQPIRLTDGTTRYDYEYERNGVGNIFMAVEPLAGKREVKIFKQRTKKEWVEFMSYLAEEVYPGAERITVILDNLNTHDPAAFYEFYPAAKAKVLLDKFEFVYTPEHGSWLNVAECELSVLMSQCLNRRIAHIEEVRREVKAWQQDRNNRQATIHWQFEDQDARVKLRHLYPNI